MFVRSLLAAVCALAFAGTALAQSAANVLVVYNDRAPGADALATMYTRARGIPDAQRMAVHVRPVDEIALFEFERDIQTPIRTWLSANRAQDRILYIVLIKGVPLRIGGSTGRTGTRASVDSELALLYRRMSGANAPIGGAIPNPYFGAAGEAAPTRFSHAAFDIYLVTRLDGFSSADVQGLIERGGRPAASGGILLDQRPGFDRPNDWLAAAARALETGQLGGHVTVGRNAPTRPAQQGLLGFFSWGSNDPAWRRVPNVTFVPGAIAGMFLSSDARTFTEPPANWKPAPDQQPSTLFAGSAQALVGDLVRAGVTGASGQVAEPFLDGAVRPDILFPAYAGGLNLAESFYRAIPSVSWQTVVIGDPLCAPFAGVPIAPAEIDPSIDPATELPSLFGARRLASIATLTTSAAAAAATVRGESRQARQDLPGARAAFEEAVAADPAMTTTWQLLATVYEETQAFSEANDVYRRLLEKNPKDVIALNNLAYNLGVRDTKRDEALVLAERAQVLAPGNPSVLDTLGWLQHLQGDTAGAAKVLTAAARLAPTNAEIQLHAALALAAAGYQREAAQALERAKAANAAIATRADFLEAAKTIGATR